MRLILPLGIIAFLILLCVFMTRLVYLPSEVGLLGAVKPNHVTLGETNVKQTRFEVYASYDYDCAVLGLALPTPNKETRYLPLYGSTYRGLPPLKADLYVSDNEDGLWIEVSWKGQPAQLLEYFPLDSDGSPELAPGDSFSSQPIPTSFSGYSNPSRPRDSDAINILSVRHDEE